MANPFSDGQVVESRAVDLNPYAPPPHSGKGWYDWTLARQAFVTVAIVLLMWLIPAAVGSYKLLRLNRVVDDPIKLMKSLIADYPTEEQFQ